MVKYLKNMAIIFNFMNTIFNFWLDRLVVIVLIYIFNIEMMIQSMHHSASDDKHTP